MNANTLPEAADWRASLERHQYEEALGRLKAMALIGQNDPETLDALERIVYFFEALRAKNYAGAKRVDRTGWSALDVQVLGLDEALESLITAEESWRNGDERVRAALQVALTHELTKAEAHNQLGVLEAVCEQPDLARGHFQAALSTDPRHHRAITNLGNLELEAGNLQTAEVRYREALKLNPDYSVAYNNLAAVLKRQGKRSEAVDMLKKSQRLSLKELRGQAKGTGKNSGGTNPLGGGLTATLTKLWANQTARTVIVVVLLVILYQIFKR
jgi:tetratricopeptide (TPR) repeat protein